MTDQRKRLSELSTSASTDGLYTLGVNAQNEGVKIPFGDIIKELNSTDETLRKGVQALQTSGAAMNDRIGAIAEDVEQLKGYKVLQDKRIDNVESSIDNVESSIDELFTGVAHLTEQADASSVYRCVVAFDGVVASSSDIPEGSQRYAYYCEDTGLFVVDGRNVSDYMSREGMSVSYSVRRDVLFLNPLGVLYVMTASGFRSFADVVCGSAPVVDNEEIDSMFKRE